MIQDVWVIQLVFQDVRVSVITPFSHIFTLQLPFFWTQSPSDYIIHVHDGTDMRNSGKYNFEKKSAENRYHSELS